MKTGLSKREKVLLILTAVIAVSFFGIRFAIMPMYDRYITTLDDYNVRSTEKTLLEAKIRSEEMLRETFAEAESAYEDLKAEYPKIMLTEDVDRLLTGICLENKLTPVSLKMSEPVTLGALLQRERQMYNQLNNQTGTEDSSAANYDSYTAFVIMEANMELSGSYESLKGLIDTVETFTYLRISRVTYALPKENDREGNPNISVYFEVTMLNELSAL